MATNNLGLYFNYNNYFINKDVWDLDTFFLLTHVALHVKLTPSFILHICISKAQIITTCMEV